MVVYLGWVCSQMAPRTVGGMVLLIGIFGGVIASAVAAAVGVWHGSRQEHRGHGSREPHQSGH